MGAPREALEMSLGDTISIIVIRSIYVHTESSRGNAATMCMYAWSLSTSAAKTEKKSMWEETQGDISKMVIEFLSTAV